MKRSLIIIFVLLLFVISACNLISPAEEASVPEVVEEPEVIEETVEEVVPEVEEEPEEIPDEVEEEINETIEEEVEEEPENGISQEEQTKINTECLSTVKLRIHEACFDSDDDLEIDLENEGTMVVSKFSVEAKDVFDEELYDIGELTEVSPGERATKKIPMESFSIKPYSIRVKPYVNIGGVEGICVPATEVYTVSESEFDDC